MPTSKPPHVLFVGSYNNFITTLHFDADSNEFVHKSVCSRSMPSPSWQLLDRSRKLLYSTNEGFPGVGGNVDIYTYNESGKLKHEAVGQAPECGVSLALDGNSLFVAHYMPPAVSLFDLSDSGTEITDERCQTTKYDIIGRGDEGINPIRQDCPHPHQVLLCPNKKDVLLVPDLGYDIIRVYRVTSRDDDKKPSFEEVEKSQIKLENGAGPRHVIFDSTGTYMYCVEELANMVSVFKMTQDSELSFEFVQRISTFGKDGPPKNSNNETDKPKAAEIHISADNGHLYVSNRFDASLDDNDTIVHYQVSKETGTLEFQELTSMDGINIRHFSIGGEMEEFVAVAAQDSGKVIIYKRDNITGRIGEKLAEEEVGEAVCVNWM